MVTYHDKHLHLGGATPCTTLWELIVDAGLKTNSKNYWEFEKALLIGDNANNLNEYLDIIHIVDNLQTSPSAIEKCVFQVFSNSYLTGAHDLELRFNPIKRNKKGLIDLDRILVAARGGYERAKTVYGIHGSFIMCMGRDCTEEENYAVFSKAVAYYKKGVSGIDVAGDEALPLSPEFKHYYAAARSLGMTCTIHAGEIDKPTTEEELAHIIETLRPNRIGHGIKAVGFPRILKMISSNNIELEICISSNLATGVVSGPEDFQVIFKTLEEYQIKYSINTDSTSLLQTNIAREHDLYKVIRAG